MDKLAELRKLEAEMAADATLPLMPANLVFGEGDIDCKVLFIGEAPGETEDRLKRPFVGRGGQLLDRMIESIGWKRADVYITNIVKRRPPENRDPSPDEIEAYKPYLARQIEIIDPKVIATLGRFSMNYFLPLAKISRDHGHVLIVDGRFIFPLFHPAYALRSPVEAGSVLAEDFKKLPKVLSGEIAPETPEAFVPAMPPARAEKKNFEKPKQVGLF
jgi:DNA polymerase